MPIKFIFFTDSHFSSHFTEFAKPDKEFINSRFKIQCQSLEKILKLAIDKDLPVIFGGDMFDIRNQIDIQDYNFIYSIFAKYPEAKCWLLRGNHDSINNLMGSPSSIDMFKYLPNKVVISNPTNLKINDTDLYFMPYGENYDEITAKLKEFGEDAKDKQSILVAHLGINGAIMNGSKSRSKLYAKDFYPDNFNLVYLGHFHKRQAIDGYNNMFYGGSLFQNTFSDAGSDKGYDIIEVGSDTYKDSFYDLGNPKFYTVFDWNDQSKKLAEEGNYVRLQSANTKDISAAKQSDNVRTELQKNFQINSRLDIKKDDTPIEITKKYLDKNKIDAFDEAKELLKN